MRETADWGINPPFGGLSPARGQVAHVLRTRSPLSTNPKVRFSFDLHVLTTPPAFTLSQDQTHHTNVLFICVWFLTLVFPHSPTFKVLLARPGAATGSIFPRLSCLCQAERELLDMKRE